MLLILVCIFLVLNVQRKDLSNCSIIDHITIKEIFKLNTYIMSLLEFL